MQRHRLWFSLLVILVIVSSLLAACVSTPSPAATPEGAKPGVAPTTGAGAKPAATPAQGAATGGPTGTFKVGVDLDLVTWDAQKDATGAELSYYSLVYEGLVGEDAKGNQIPGLATKWTVNPKSIDFTLRDKAVFHDGTPFNAAAVKANIERAKASGFGNTVDSLASIDTVDVVDDTHVRFNLNRSDPALLTTLQRQPGYMISPAAFNKLEQGPVGTGPWKYNATDSVKNSKYIFDLNKDYYDLSQIGVQRVEVYFLEDYQAAFNAVQKGDVDATTIVEAQVAQAKSAGFDSILPDATFPIALHILDRGGKLVPALADERVRLALSYAIDRKAFVDTVLSGVGKPLTQMRAQGQYGYCEETKVSYDPNKAKQLLSDAGVSNLSFDVPSFGMFNQWNEGFAGFFKQIGVTMNVKPMTPGPIQPEAASGKWAAAIVPITERHVATFYNNRISPNGYLNPFKVAFPDLDALANQAYQATDDKTAEPLWAQINCGSAEKGLFLYAAMETQPIMINPNRLKRIEALNNAADVPYYRTVVMK